MAAAALRRSAKSTPGRSSNQSCLKKNSGQVTEDGPPCLGARFRARAAVTREQPHTASTTGSSDQYANSISLVPTGPTTGWVGFVPPTVNEHASLAGDDLNSTAIVDAQLTPPVSQHDDTQRQDAPRVQDAPMPDAPAVHDIATPRR